ncbi:hypothetical protein T10_8143 [Trichinella papuae]|uniref:Uncharacterized protein n=1 Tax=Trichinella papuae TaxID=268474 RepID=A0A0V1N5G3_9BILA|nr:hypothetical protein T10_8143 [Trichinella papuae]
MTLFIAHPKQLNDNGRTLILFEILTAENKSASHPTVQHNTFYVYYNKEYNFENEFNSLKKFPIIAAAC